MKRYGMASLLLMLGLGIAIAPRAIAFSQPSPAPPSPLIAQQAGDVVDVAHQAGSFSIFLGLLDELGLQEDLRGYGRFTVFAPTDAAFEALGTETLTTLRGDRERLAKILAYHIIASAEPLYTDNIDSTTRYRTLERNEVELRTRRDNMVVNDIEAIASNIAASNGVIHTIDQVLMPPE